MVSVQGNNLQNARINQQRAELNSQNVRNQLRQTIEQAYLDAVAAGKSYVSSQKQVAALSESMKNAEQRKALNVITPHRIQSNIKRFQPS